MKASTRKPRRTKIARRKPLNYPLRDIDPEVWAAVRVRANQEGRTLRWVIVKLLALYANRKIDL